MGKTLLKIEKTFSEYHPYGSKKWIDISEERATMNTSPKAMAWMKQNPGKIYKKKETRWFSYTTKTS